MSAEHCCYGSVGRIGAGARHEHGLANSSPTGALRRRTPKRGVSAANKAAGNLRDAFTMLELIVVIAVIALLIALLLPAVQSIREVSRRTQCKSNVKQLVLAMQTYESAHQVFPLSYGKGRFTAANTGASWMQMILPNIDQGNLSAKLHFGMPLSDPANTVVAQTIVPVFLCPADTSGGTMDFRDNVSGLWAVNNYKACAGSNWKWGSFSPVVSSVGRNSNNPDGLDHGNGIIWRGYGNDPPVTRMAQIRDGLGHTFAVGEAVPEWCRHTWWYWFNGTTATCAIPLNYKKQPDLQLAMQGDWPENYSFLSRHNGGANFGMADGSVRFVADAIDQKVYRGLGTIQGSEPIGDF